MARVQNPIIGRASGSLGSTVFSTYLDRNVIKSKPIEVKPSNTPAQANQRALLKKISGIVRDLSASGSIAKRSARTGRNPKNTAKSALSGAIFARVSGVAPTREILAGGIALQGDGISHANPITVECSGTSDMFTATWQTEVPTGGSASDKVSFACFETVNGGVFHCTSSVLRSAGTAQFQAREGFVVSGRKYACFVMFDAADGLTFDNAYSVESIGGI